MLIKFKNGTNSISHVSADIIDFNIEENTVYVFHKNRSDGSYYRIAVSDAAMAQNAHFDSLSAGERIFDLTPYQTTETKTK
jgi:hypothetical protein